MILGQTYLFYEYRGTYTYWWQIREILKLAEKCKNQSFWARLTRLMKKKGKKVNK